MLLRDLLLEHFGSIPLEELVVSRQEFPLWMRVDVQAEVEKFMASLGHFKFTGVRLRGNVDFRFPNLVEGGEDAPATGPAVWSALDRGDAEPARCLLRGLWLAQVGSVRFGMTLEFDEDSGYSESLRIEIAAPPGAEPERFAIDLQKRFRAAGEAARSLRGKTLSPARSPNARYSESTPDFGTLEIAPAAREEMVLAPGVLDLIEGNTIGFAAHVGARSSSLHWPAARDESTRRSKSGCPKTASAGCSLPAIPA